jgi:hypothetical protein
MRVTKAIPLGWPLPLTVATVNHAATLKALGAIFLLQKSTSRAGQPEPAQALAVYHDNLAFVRGAGAGAGDVGAAENADYLEAVQGQEILYDNKCVPGAQGKGGGLDLDVDGYVVDESSAPVERGAARNVDPHGYVVDGSLGNGAGVGMSGAGAGGGGIDAEYAAASTSLSLNIAAGTSLVVGQNTACYGELTPTTPRQPHGHQHHCRYTKAGVSGSVCQAKAVQGHGYSFCPRHTCQRTGCSNVKTSQVKLCDPCSPGGGSHGSESASSGAGSGGRGNVGRIERSGRHKVSVYAGFEGEESEL